MDNTSNSENKETTLNVSSGLSAMRSGARAAGWQATPELLARAER